MAGVSIKLDARVVKGLEEVVKASLSTTADALKTEVVNAQVMPFDTGDMQNNQTFVDPVSSTKVRIVTGSPQARRLYYHPEYNFQKVNNPNAGGEWLKPWIDGEKADFAQKSFAENFKKEAGL